MRTRTEHAVLSKKRGMGVLFGAISLAGAQLPELLIYAGSVFWMLACAQQMLRRSV